MLNSAHFHFHGNVDAFFALLGRQVIQPLEAEHASTTILDKDEVVVADLDLDMIEQVRKVWQFFRDRRPETYGPLTAQTGVVAAAD